jgi:hypothetical protein
VPNSYRLRLAPADLERFADYSATLSRELSRYLLDYARDRGLRPIAEPHVELMSDAGVRPGSVRAEARFVDLPPARKSELDAALDGTRRLRLADLAGAQPLAPACADSKTTLWLSDRLGLRVRLDPQVGMVRLGRAADNDIAIANQRVSRYHAQLRWVESSWLLYDLDSTNGTFVDQERVFPSRPRAVRSGTLVRLGDHELELTESSDE